MLDHEARMDEARQRALLITERVMSRPDEKVRQMVQNFNEPLDFEERLEDLAIAEEAWGHVLESEIEPRLVFTHPDLLRAHPETSLHYRGIATLSLKRVSLMGANVTRWEREDLRSRPRPDTCLRAARIFNAVISVVITGTDGWTLENGYRNVLATIGITEDGALRNIVGEEGEAAVKDRISQWLAENESIPTVVDGPTTLIGADQDVRMIYGSEPDISFERRATGDWQIVSTVEIKSGTDPAGALERLGAIQKSFEQTPQRSRNFTVVGIVTSEMRRRLDEMNVARDFLLYQILNDEAAWDDFLEEIFHHTLRVT